MLVDPEILRAFAGQVDFAIVDIGAANLGGKTVSAGDSLPGSTTQWAVGAVGEHVADLVSQLSRNVTDMGAAVRGAGSAFEVADEALAGAFDGLF